MLELNILKILFIFILKIYILSTLSIWKFCENSIYKRFKEWTYAFLLFKVLIYKHKSLAAFMET